MALKVWSPNSNSAQSMTKDSVKKLLWQALENTTPVQCLVIRRLGTYVKLDYMTVDNVGNVIFTPVRKGTEL